MTMINILTKSSFSFEVAQNINFPALRRLLNDVAPLYPSFDAWLNFTFRRNMASGERRVLIAHNGSELVGAALLKDSLAEGKICTFFVSPDHRQMNIGGQLLDQALRELDRDDAFITVAEERKAELSPLLTSRGFSVGNSISSLYRPGSTEYLFTL
tara:strand:- start:347 stop:814 length:468 start_codon:yes stop_codon:yes gene_type:complete